MLKAEFGVKLIKLTHYSGIVLGVATECNIVRHVLMVLWFCCERIHFGNTKTTTRKDKILPLLLLLLGSSLSHHSPPPSLPPHSHLLPPPPPGASPS